MKHLVRRSLFALIVCSTHFLSYSYGQASPRGKKIALIIGIGQYQPDKGWSTIHGDHDVDLMKHALMNAGFPEGHISYLKNKDATKAGIVAAFNKLIETAGPGDIVIFHYSGHGQQISDINGDEPDGLDEALVPYDAGTSPDYGSGSDHYKSIKHLTDDELSAFFDEIRYRTGPSGQLIAFIDACHSGTASRGNGVVRGGVAPLVIPGVPAKKANRPDETNGSGYLQLSVQQELRKGKFVLFSAARAEEKDYEYEEKQLGSLSYAIADAFENKLRTPESSFRDLFEHVRNTMAIIVPSQNPQLEGDKDAQIFGGDMVLQEPFYKVAGSAQNNLLEISGGKLFGIKEGVQIGLYPVGTRTTAGPPVVTGKIIKADNLKSYFKPERNIPADSAQKLKAFVLSPVFDNSLIKVSFGQIPAGLKEKLKDELSKKKISLTDNPSSATLIIDLNDRKQIEILHASTGIPIVNPFDPFAEIIQFGCGGISTGSADPATYIVQTMANYARNNVIRNATFGDKNFGLKVQILHARIDKQSGQPELVGSDSLPPVFNTKHSQAVLKVENTGSRTGYVYLIEFDPSGKICPLIGFDTEVRLKPGAKDETTIPGFAPPFGRYVIKGYITEEPIGNELSWLISEQNAGARAATSNNGLIRLLGELLQNPGKARGPSLDKSGGVGITNFSYDISEE